MHPGITNTDKLDRFAGDLFNRERSTAAGITLHLGQDNTGDLKICVELIGNSYSILAGHGIGHKQNLCQGHSAGNFLQLVHQLLIYMEPTCGIDNDGIVALVFSFGNSPPGNVDRILLGTGSKNRDPNLVTEHPQLLNGGRTINVGGYQKRLAPFLLELPGKLGRGCGFTRALQTGHHDGHRLTAVKTQRFSLAAEQGDQFIVDNLNNLLARRKTGQNLLTNSLLRDSGDKLFDNLKVDISFQQRRTHFTHGLLNIVFSQLTVAAQLFEYTIKAIC